MGLSVSVIVPCYNESERIAATIAALNDYLTGQHRSFELIAVDDGSSDGTVAELERVARVIDALRVVRNGLNRGKGYSVKHGVQHASKEVVLFTDADLSTPAEEIGRALQVFETADFDIVIGSRTAPGANIEIRQPLYRVLMGRAFAFLIHSLLGLRGVSDTQCGFKVFRREAAQDVFSRQILDRFAFDVEILYLSQQLGYKVYEMPVTWRNRPESKVSPVRDSLRMFRDVVAIKRRHAGLSRSAARG